MDAEVAEECVGVVADVEEDFWDGGGFEDGFEGVAARGGAGGGEGEGAEDVDVD